MKALTLMQPWATLVAIGAKRIETRSWGTRYSGPLAIHAAKGCPKWARETFYESPFFEVLRETGLTGPKDLPLGVIVATCNLQACRFTRDVAAYLSEQECAFGDYTDGRFAWILSHIVPTDLIPARGSLGLWEWNDQPNGVGGI
jgi:hypothetical protein